MRLGLPLAIAAFGVLVMTCTAVTSFEITPRISSDGGTDATTDGDVDSPESSCGVALEEYRITKLEDAPPTTRQVLVGDLDGQGFDDLLLLMGSERSFTLVALLTESSDSGPEPQQLPALRFPTNVVVGDVRLADLDGDRRLEGIAFVDRRHTTVPSSLGGSMYELFVENGADGNTLSYRPHDIPQALERGVLADLNGDGDLDVLAGSPTEETPTRLLAWLDIPADLGPDPIEKNVPSAPGPMAAIADPEGGRAAVAVTFPGERRLRVYTLDEHGSDLDQSADVDLDTCAPTGIWHADATADGDAELILACSDGGPLIVPLGEDLSLGTPSPIAGFTASPGDVATAFDGGGGPVLAAVPGPVDVEVYCLAADGAVLGPSSVHGVDASARVALGDLDGDGAVDVVVSRGDVRIFWTRWPTD